MDDLCKTQNHSVMNSILQTRQKALLSGLLILLTFPIFAQRVDPAVKIDKDAPREVLKETNREELLRISQTLETQYISRRKAVEEFARKNNIEIRKELPNGKVIQLMDVENGHPWFYVTHNTGAATTTRANQLMSGGSLGLNLDGSSIPPIGVWDAGLVLSSHQEFMSGEKSRVIQKDDATSISNHATHVVGTLIANGTTAKAKGMVSNATVYAYNWSLDAAEMAAAAAEGMLISNHSYGYTYGWLGSNWYGNANISDKEDYRFGFYSTVTRTWDNIAYNAPYYLIVKSAGNDRNEGPTDGAYPKDGYPDGFDCIGTDAIGKNILTVGNVSQVSNYTGPSSVTMSSNSAWGPADDGRIKPDVVGKGVMVYSATGSSSTAYATMSGTSMASPNVAGTLALLQEYYMQLNGSYMRSATLKGLTIHTTDEAGPADGPDYMFGWGLVNAERAAQVISANQTNSISIQELTLTNNGTYLLEVYSDGTQPLKATIVWTDPAGRALPASLDPETPALVHDLDLLISGNNTNYFPWKLDKNNPAAPATRNSKNFVDNVEVVLIDNPTPGVYTIKVSHDGSLTANQDFSLIITGARKNTVTAPIADFVADKTTITIGDYVQFSNLSANNPTSYKWEFSGAEVTASSEANPKVKFVSSGTFTIKLTATNSAGSNTKTRQGYITVQTAPLKADFSASKTFISEGETITFSDKSLNNPSKWNWTFEGGNPSTSTAQNPTVTYAKAGVYNVTLKVTNTNSTDELTKTGYIAVAMKAPVAGFTADKTEIFIGESVQFNDQSQNAQSYDWTFEGGTPTTSKDKSPLVKYNVAGTYSVTQKVSNSTSSDTKTQQGLITVKNLPVKADFTATPTSISEGGSVNFTDKSANNPTSWNWTFQGGTPSTSTVQNPKVTYNKSGVYSVTLTVSNSSSNDQIVKTGFITVNANAPVAGFTVDKTEIFVGESVQFTDLSQYAQSFEWTFTGGTPAVATEKNPMVTYNSAGIYSVTQKVFNGTSSDSKTIAALITVKNLPVKAEFDASTTSVTEGGSVSFKDKSTNNPTNWIWTFEGGTPSTSTLQNPIISYNKAGVYNVTLKVSNGNSEDQLVKSGLIAVTMKSPVAGFTVDKTEIFVGGSVQFIDASQNATTYNWIFDGGNPATSTQKSPVVTYNAAGTFTVTQRVTNSVGSDTKMVSSMIKVKPLPVSANFSASSTTIKEGEKVRFTDLSMNNPTSWSWSFSGGTPSTSNQQNPEITYTTPGIYDVSLIVSDGNTTDIMIQPGYIVVVMKAPVAGFVLDKSEIIAGEFVQFTDQSQNAQTYEWTFEGGTPATSSLSNPRIKYENPGVYHVTQKVANSSGADTKTSIITVKEPPVDADFVASVTTITEGEAVEFKDLSKNNPVSWSWSFPGGNPSVSNERNPKVTYPKPGKYDVSLKVLNSNGSDELLRSGYITVNMKSPVADFNASKTEIFAGESVVFNNLSLNADTYSWMFEGGTPSASSAINPEVKYNTPGIYSVSLKATNSKTSDTKTKLNFITVKVLPAKAEFTASSTRITEGGTVAFTDLSENNPVSWNWSFPGGSPSSSNEKNPQVVYARSGVYNVTLLVSNASGSTQMIKENYIVVGMNQPVAGFKADKTEIYVGEKIQFTDQSINAQSYGWTFQGGNPSTSSEKSPLVTYNTAGTYTVTQVVTNDAGSNSISTTITVKPLPVKADFTASTTSVTEGDIVSFTDLSLNNPTSWNWTFAGGNPSSSNEKNPKVTYPKSGVYSVTLSVSNSYSTHEITRNAYISVAMKAPVASFNADRTSILAGELVQFTDQSQNALTFEWTFDGGNPSSSNQKNPVVKYNNAGVYSVKLVVSNSTDSDVLVKEGFIKVDNPQEKYPEISSMSSNNEWINTVSIGNFTNRNSGPSTYSDFTNQKIVLTEGLSYALTLSPGYNGTRNPLNWKIWIDFNNDMDFDDPGEEIFTAFGIRNNANGKITIPNGTAPITTRMRVAMRHGDIPVSWGTFARGEVEDYTIEIITKNAAKSEEQGLSLREPAFKAYPNPVRDNLFIQLDNWDEPYEVRMTDLSGRVVYNKKTSDNIILIDVNGFNKGLYILTVTDGKNTNSQRVTVH